MPKFSWYRHQLAEQQIRLTGDIKTSISPTSEESWQSENQNTDAYIIHENADHPDNNDDHEEIEEEPLELVTRRPEPEDLSADPVKNVPQPEPPVRTLAAKKYFDEPLDISIQRKATEQQDDEALNKKRSLIVDRYHPYNRQEIQEGPMNLEVPKKPWYNGRSPSNSPPIRGLKVQDEPVDFSKKKEVGEAVAQRKIVGATYKRQYQFQRNLLVILLQNINRNPLHGKNIVRYLKRSCDKIQTRGCSGGKNGTPNQTGSGGQQGQQSGGGGGGVSGGGSSGVGGYNGSGTSNGSTGGSLNSSRSNSTDNDDGNNLFDVSETDFDSIDFDFNESATRKWITDNPDLSPLKVLDHISFKPDPAPDQHHQDHPKPPDLDTLDRDTASILQLAVPVPDPSSTFLDIGTDFGPVSFYEDDPFNLEQLVPSTFNLNNMNNSNNSGANTGANSAHHHHHPHHNHHHQPLYPIHHQNNNNQQQQSNILHLNSNIILQQHNNIRQQHQPAPPQQSSKMTSALELTSQINFGSFMPDSSITNSISPITRHAADNHNNIKYAVKTEPQPPPPQQQPQQHFHPSYPQIKEEAPMGYHGDSCCPQSPETPSTQCGGKMRTSPQRKKSTSSSNDEEDLMNVPSLQMRIQILQQRFGIPTDAPLELINGGHGIKNPMVADVPEKKEVEKLPPLRSETDPSKFACRVCGKAFTLQRLLNRHMKCHSDTKRYLCTFCGKGFNDTFDLKRHTRTHTGVRPYKCNLCEKSFTQRCSLESHCLKVHGVNHSYEYKQRRSKVYVCEDCGHTTKEPEVHYVHLKEQHPYSPALLKFYDKRHFKFNNTNFASNLLTPAM